MYEIIIGRSDADREKLGLAGTILLGKHYVKMGQVTSLSSNIFLDVNSSHVVFICGKRGSGKCLTGDSLIPLQDGSLKTIKDLEKNKLNVFGLNNKLKIGLLEKEGFYKRKVDKLLKLKLATGKEIGLTPEHPLLTINGWAKAEDLNLNERIATPRNIPCFGNEKLSKERIKILAYIIAEGHITNKIVRFTNFDKKIQDEFKQILEKIDSNIKASEYQEGQFGIVSKKVMHDLSGLKRNKKGQFVRESKIIPQKTILLKWLISEGIAGKKAGDKFIPEIIFKLKKEDIALFLNRLFSCDGTIYRKKSKDNFFWQVSYASKSKKMIKQIQHLLLRFGLVSTIRTRNIKLNGKRFRNYELIVLDCDKYINEIGFFGEKEERQKKAKKENKTKIKNPNIDVIPKELWNYYKPKSWAEVGRKIGYAFPKALRESKRYSPSRQKLSKIAMFDEREDIRLIAESDIFWDRIISIEHEKGSFEVYDISVPEMHNFIANDIIVHNSYTMGVIAEGIAGLPTEIKNNLCTIIFDTMGVYWTMKFPNPEKDMLKQWGLEGKGLGVEIYTPVGYYKLYKEKGIPTDYPFSLKPSDLDSSDWCAAFDIEVNSPEGVLIERVVNELKESGSNFDISDVIKAARSAKDAEETSIRMVVNQFEKAMGWGLFSKEGTKIEDLTYGGKTIIIDLSCYATQSGTWGIRALVIGIISQKVFLERMVARKQEENISVTKSIRYFTAAEKTKIEIATPLIWLMLDEAHEFLPKDGKTAATNALITILREGRQPGVSLILVTQQPGKIHTDVMTQADIVISHRITAKIDVTALGTLMQSYMRKDLDEELNVLPRVSGAAIVFDDMNERMFPMRIAPRITWHGGSAPKAVEEAEKKKEF
jgi:intein/homing endonuclease